MPRLHRAAESGDLDTVNERLTKGDPVDRIWGLGWTALQLACFDGHLPIVRVLLKHGAQVNLADAELGMTPLHNAGINGHYTCASLLLRYGADINAIMKRGASPLAVSASSQEASPRLIRMLLSAGATPDLQDKYGQTALHEAAHAQRPELCRVLLEAGARTDLRDDGSLTAQEVAQNTGYRPVIRVFS
jgi:ankyrin repeat protein